MSLITEEEAALWKSQKENSMSNEEVVIVGGVNIASYRAEILEGMLDNPKYNADEKEIIKKFLECRKAGAKFTPPVMVAGIDISDHPTEVLGDILNSTLYTEEEKYKVRNILKSRNVTWSDYNKMLQKNTADYNNKIQQAPISNYKVLPRAKDSAFQANLADVINEIFSMLIEKNRKYGNSVAEPIGVFSKLEPIQAINVRIDDKLARIRSGQPDETEDSELDLIGYLILKRVLRYESKPE